MLLELCGACRRHLAPGIPAAAQINPCHPWHSAALIQRRRCFHIVTCLRRYSTRNITLATSLIVL